MRLAAPLGSPLFEGTAGTSPDVPSRFDAALDGRVFMFDEKYMGSSPQMARESVSLYKPQQDDSPQVSEASLNPEDLARAAGESWHRGAGQRFFDRPGSDPYRFRRSKGVDPWTRDQFSLLPGTDLLVASANTNLRLAPTSTRLFWIDGADVKYDDDLTGTPSTMTALPGTTFTSITTNGYDVWACDGASVFHWLRSETSVDAATSAVDVDLLVWVRGKGRLMASHDEAVYNITDHTAASFTDISPSVISTDFRWVGFADGPSCVYGAGYEGDKSNIFRWGIKADGTGLDAAVPALIDGLPDGEIVRSIYPYGGVLVIGTDEGFRLATANEAGDLTVGPLVDLGAVVRCFEGQGRHIWFGWTNYDSTSTGLGRIDPTQFTDSNVPAYASDLMAADQGDVLDVCTYAGKRVFAVSGGGIYVQSTDLVASGTLDTGLITHGLPDPKVGMYVIVNHDELEGTVAAAVSVDGGAAVGLGSSSVAGETTRVLNAGEARGETAELTFTLTRDSSDATAGPNVNRWTYEANPAPGRGAVFWVFFKFFDDLKDKNGNTVGMDTLAAYNALEQMVNDGAPHTYQDGGGALTVFVDDFRFYQEKVTDRFYDGTFAAKLRRPRRRVT